MKKFGIAITIGVVIMTVGMLCADYFGGSPFYWGFFSSLLVWEINNVVQNEN